ncbi:MAG: hypothetical protein ACT4OY_00870 [Alphaproteobacteria bacterium]
MVLVYSRHLELVKGRDLSTFTVAPSPVSSAHSSNSLSQIFPAHASPVSASAGVAVTVNPIVAPSRQSSDQYAVKDNAPTIDALKQDAARADGALHEQVNDIKSEVIKVMTDVAQEQGVDMGAFLKSCNTDNSSDLMMAMAYIGGTLATGGVGGFAAGGFGSLVTAGTTGADILKTITKDRNLSSGAVHDVLRTTAARLNTDTQAKIQQLTGAKPVADSNAAFTARPQSAITGGQVAEFLRTPPKAFKSERMRNNEVAINSMKESNETALAQNEKPTEQKIAAAIISDDEGALKELAGGDTAKFEKLEPNVPEVAIDSDATKDEFENIVAPQLRDTSIGKIEEMLALTRTNEIESILKEELRRQRALDLTGGFQTPSRNASFGMNT